MDNEFNDVFTKEYKEKISLFGSDKRKEFERLHPYRNIRYFIWEKVHDYELDVTEKYVPWCNKMWSRFQKETGYQYFTPVVHVLFDNWLIEKTNIL